MTLAASGINYWPARHGSENSTGLTLLRSNLTFDSDTDVLAWVGTSPVADTISKIYFRTGTVTAGCDVKIQLETVTNGRPTGTLVAAGAEATVTIADTDDAVWKTATIGTPPTLAVGDEFAIVMRVDIAGPTPNLVITTNASESAHAGMYPLCLQDTGAGTWSYVGGFEWIVECGTAGIVPFSNLSSSEANSTQTAFNNSSTPDEYGMKFVMPFKCRCIGVSAIIGNVAAGADFTMSLWPATSTTDGDALGQKVIDGDTPTSATVDGYYSVHFPAVTLTAGTTYYIGIRADTANNISTSSFLSPSGISNSMTALNLGIGTAFQVTRAWTAGSTTTWTETDTNRFPIMSIIYDQLDDGAGGSGTTIAGTPMLRGMV